MLNRFILSKSRLFKIVLTAAFCCGVFFGAGCGKRKPPAPPLERVVQRTEIAGTQKGNLIVLRWQLPEANAPGKSLQNISRADVYRLTEPVSAPLTLSEEEFAARATIVSSVKATEVDFLQRQMIYTDVLEFAGQNARLRYAVRFVNESGQKAGFSNFLLIEPSAKVAGNPTSLRAQISEKAILLEWNAPTANVDGTTPANIVGYNIYRAENSTAAEKILNRQPLTNENFRDESFEFGNDYRYFVRAVSLGGGSSEPVESADSETIEVRARDVFPPSAPSAVTVAAAPANISIFFAVNPEKDIAGYQVYRSTERDRNLSEWSLLTEVLLTTNTFRDTNVRSNVTYFYYLKAVDKTGNVSAASEIVSETAP